jgi:hypothetical protein
MLDIKIKDLIENKDKIQQKEEEIKMKIKISLKKNFIKRPLIFLDEALERNNRTKLKDLNLKLKGEKGYKNYKENEKEKEDSINKNNLKV